MIDANKDPKILEDNPVWNEKVNKKTAFALFLLNCAWPICFYFAYVHCNGILKTSFNYNPEQIVNHNFIVSLVELANFFVLVYLVSTPKILKILLICDEIKFFHQILIF